jgi:hypothetical protein
MKVLGTRLLLLWLASAPWLACAPRTLDDPHPSTTLTGASLAAAPASDAELSRAVAAGSADPILSAVTSAVLQGDDARVLALTDADATAGTPPSQRSGSPWWRKRRSPLRRSSKRAPGLDMHPVRVAASRVSRRSVLL